MKKIYVLTSLIICIAGLNQPSFADNHTQMDQYVDFAELNKIYGEPKVKINLQKGLIKLMAGLAKNGDPEAGAVLAGIEAVSVSVYNLGGKQKAAFKSIQKISKRMEKLNWLPAVSVNQEGEQVRIFVKQNGEMIEGLLVLSAGKKDEAVFVNIVGNIDPAKIGQVSESLNLDLGFGTKQDNSE